MFPSAWHHPRPLLMMSSAAPGSVRDPLFPDGPTFASWTRLTGALLLLRVQLDFWHHRDWFFWPVSQWILRQATRVVIGMWQKVVCTLILINFHQFDMWTDCELDWLMRSDWRANRPITAHWRHGRPYECFYWSLCAAQLFHMER